MARNPNNPYEYMCANLDDASHFLRMHGEAISEIISLVQEHQDFFPKAKLGDNCLDVAVEKLKELIDENETKTNKSKG